MNPSVRTAQILIVEDDPVIGMLLQDMVRLLGYVPAGPAGSIKAALQLIDAHPRLDAAVLDCELGKQFVWPVADRLAASNIPFIFSTGYSGAVPERFTGLSVLSKPFSVATLKTALVRAMGA